MTASNFSCSFLMLAEIDLAKLAHN
ncbi:unnamed protein product [Nyctereutes procyonoides]|uniref:(raccoon dog) hypothetical protein n=1 Tax=Nyctereutes procyonoides TaxID=34880 RepID=A0A811ZP44_NYCPR|nr:unnamed protein product [Nyctereutes procyonoides]